ncbi:formylglycine-generating enzyme family protein [Marilutibacter alkalisoli]|uniref:Formylglycine-generating enzyme family protein n=1 Tax=Marilutibacter alkalisoli TaxID=2591633 RepID=A0A514BQK3_9GAMM|nr:formylglycine-generating enzyme family protein [Lysobacter alkalisoli]QDH69636.1 formylglycine-generating enzyme family protein [Lysobacter alkalisoli]
MVATSLALLVLLAAPLPATPLDFIEVPAGGFVSAVKYEGDDRVQPVAGFAMSQRPVTVGEFEVFVRANPQWQRDGVPSLLADGGYLARWQDAGVAGGGFDADAPVTQVSWFAADAYCRSIGARLPDWLEWEYVAAADPARSDARDDATWRKRLLDDGTPRAVDARADAAPNAYGISGLHGAVWEWVGDFSTLLGDADMRGSENGDRLKFCGATGLSFANRDDYALLKRVALLAGMESRSTLANLGFRCVRSSP